MAGESGPQRHPLDALGELQRNPHGFSLFAALRLLEARHRDRPRLGESRRAADDPVRITQVPSLRFATADVVEYDTGAAPSRLCCASFGLFGPTGPLPLHLTEYADERQRQYQDPTFAAFADIFHHRLASLFYRAWASAQPAVQHDRGAADRFATYVGAVFGIGSPALRGRDGVGDLAKLSLAGRFAQAVKSAEGLEDILSDFFELPCRIEQFRPQWLEIPAAERLALGAGGANELGRRANLGRRSWQCQFTFRIVLGPLTEQAFADFLPGAKGLSGLSDLVRAYLGDELSWELQLRLQQAHVPKLRLARGLRLGWSTWLGRKCTDADEVLIRNRSHGESPRATAESRVGRSGNREE